MAALFPKLGHCRIRTLGSGAFGSVSLVTLPGIPDAVAMKTVMRNENVTLQKVDNEYEVHNFLTQNNGHQNIVHLFARGDGKRSSYLYMEYVAGGTLYSSMPKSGYTPSIAQAFFKQLISGIDYMHQMGIVHRDIKPDNLLLTSNGVLKICDFGFACFFRDKAGKEKKLDERVGTEAYAAPEVSTEDSFDGPPTDCWSCGVTLFSMTVGSAPWKCAHWSDPAYKDWINKNWSAHANWRSLEPRVRDLLCKILIENPENRANLKDIQCDPWFTAKQDELTITSAKPTIECGGQDEHKNILKSSDADSTGSVVFLREVEKSSSIVFVKNVKQSGSIIFVRSVNAESAQHTIGRTIDNSEALEKKSRRPLKRKHIGSGDNAVNLKLRTNA